MSDYNTPRLARLESGQYVMVGSEPGAGAYGVLNHDEKLVAVFDTHAAATNQAQGATVVEIPFCSDLHVEPGSQWSGRLSLPETENEGVAK